MPFSVLLLTAASSERHITGYGQDRVSMSKLIPGEVALFFDKIDIYETLAKKGLNIPQNQKCCDGIVYYAHEASKVICLVEMKGSKLENAAMQLKTTYEHLRQILETDCRNCRDIFNQITWRAYVYRSGASSQDTHKCTEMLTSCFSRGNVVVSGNPDITSFLRRENETNKRKNTQKGKR
jgi:hypothetical protein